VVVRRGDDVRADEPGGRSAADREPAGQQQKWRVREASRNAVSAAAPVSRSTPPAAALDRVVGQQAEVTRPLAQQKDNERALLVLREVLLGNDRVDGL
jgi:hypothetical protein